MTSRPDAPVSHRLPTIGIGTGMNQRLVDPGAVRALSFAAEELGYSSVWTFDSPSGERWDEPHPGRPVRDVLATLETFVSATSTITVGAALLRAAWPLEDPVVERLVAAQRASGGRVALARPSRSGSEALRIGPTFQVWSPRQPELAPWATGWMFEAWEREIPDSLRLGRSGVIVRLPVHDAADRLVADIRSLHGTGASEVVLDVVADEGIDHALALYSRIAEAVESDVVRRTA